MEIYTIGFTKKTAAEFFGLLKSHSIARVIDIRLHNTSQLAGFAKRNDLEYFLRELCGAEYLHEPLLAPTEDILGSFKQAKEWPEYERRFTELLVERRVETALSQALFDRPAALLCSEPKPDRCHRRLVAEYLQAKWGDVTIIHL